ncbi:hypothetical protein EJ06DRAFT_533973 [Trichodelitschia bisporula]|uniref:EF-hand domain-containing protein n=1 Tax=Trichodelitschia bisporula TaxID=703511 RepID=A0A6G1HLD6_9PEZI|nr:hypothetical protein EJ06DRAFT_533973 [Trichodelitschia bisporula]
MRLTLVFLAAAGAAAHGAPDAAAASGHPADWATWHLLEEHHISNFDPPSFHKLHDFSNTGTWSPADIQRFYGLDDKSASHVPASKRKDVSDAILKLYDSNHDGAVSREEFVAGIEKGKRLPDFGLGPGHHGDDEYEYEIHHWEKYHGGPGGEGELNHPEDIKHYAEHEERERREEEWAKIEKEGRVVVKNIPRKFLREL